MSPSRLSVRGLEKTYPGVRALSGIDLDVAPGEIHALLGENGAGKSTLLRILSGATAPDRGAMYLDGKALDAAEGPARRQGRGVVAIYQELNLVPELSVAENIFLGREPSRRGFVDRRAMTAAAATVMARVGLGVAPGRRVGNLSVAQQQLIEIARALTLDARLLIMDEPTAALGGRDAEMLHSLVRDLALRGVSVLYVTHRLGEVIALCDRFTVLRDGCLVASGAVASATQASLTTAMVGRDLATVSRRSAASGDVALSFTAPGKSGPVLVEVRRGEIVGLAGLVGAGRTELLRQLVGADAAGASIAPVYASPAAAAQAGVHLLPEDRKGQGCFMSHSVSRNLTIASLSRLSGPAGTIRRRQEADLVAQYMARLSIRAPSAATPISALSGGNQQKVLLARYMASGPRVLIVDEPTRGVDVGAKAEVHQVLFDLAADGVALVVVSSDMPELLELADRVIVMHEGCIVGERSRAELAEIELMAMMVGADSEAHAHG